MDTRVCKVCGVEKPFDCKAFQHKHNKPIGRVCRACLNTAQNARRENPIVRAATNKCSKDYWANNKEKRAKKNNAWKKLNRPKATAWNAIRRAQQLNATPTWLTAAQKLEITAFYIEAAALTKATGKTHHVDHVIPLQSKLVCGLHVPWNLQVLLACDNISKGNRYANMGT